MNCTRTFLNASVAIAALVASPAIAQDDTVIRLPAVDATSPPVAGADGKLQDIVVTAQRRTQRLQDVPIAISAFSPRDLTTKQIRTTLDIPRLVPNMVGASNVGIGSANTYFIRGLGNTESIATFDPPVGTYVDDIYISRQNANNFSFFDIDRIEVLRGPQGTLFGRNTTGGAINVILKKPSTRLGGYAEASYGNYNSTLGAPRSTFRSAARSSPNSRASASRLKASFTTARPAKPIMATRAMACAPRSASCRRSRSPGTCRATISTTTVSTSHRR